MLQHTRCKRVLPYPLLHDASMKFRWEAALMEIEPCIISHRCRGNALRVHRRTWSNIPRKFSLNKATSKPVRTPLILHAIAAKRRNVLAMAMVIKGHSVRRKFKYFSNSAWPSSTSCQLSVETDEKTLTTSRGSRVNGAIG